MASKKDKIRAKVNKRFGKKKEEDKSSIYDHLTEEEQDAFWNSDGRCLFQEITGEQNYPQFVIDRAFKMFLDGSTIEGIATTWDISSHTVGSWSTRFQWAKKAEGIETDVQQRIVEEKLKEVQSERKEVDNRHRRLIKWMFLEFGKEWNTKTLNQKEEDIKFTRVKTLKIISDAYVKLIEIERNIVGLDVVDSEIREIPSDFEITVTLDGNTPVASEDNLKILLPHQDPHSYPMDGEIEDTPVSMLGEPDLPRISEGKAGIDPITVATRRVESDEEESQRVHQPAQPHPATGWINIGNNF